MAHFAVPSGSEMTLKTCTPSYEFTFKWTIKKYSKLPKDWEEKSPEFSIEPESNWSVKFMKRQHTFDLYISREQDTGFKMSYDITIADCNNKILFCDNGGAKGFIAKNAVAHVFSHCHTYCSTYETTLNSTPNDQILITIQIEVVKNVPITIKMDNFSITPEIRFEQMEKLSKMMNNIFDHSLKTDLTLKVEGECVKCHKAILAGMSPVFSKMFQEGMTEEEASTILIDDISLPTVRALLSFMYSAEVVEYDFDSALELYAVADRYEVLDLKDICGLILASKVTIETAFKVLYVADMHQDSVLKAKILKFVNHHYIATEKELSLNS